jgi:hypothetical protein
MRVSRRRKNAIGSFGEEKEDTDVESYVTRSGWLSIDDTERVAT